MYGKNLLGNSSVILLLFCICFNRSQKNIHVPNLVKNTFKMFSLFTVEWLSECHAVIQLCSLVL